MENKDKYKLILSRYKYLKTTLEITESTAHEAYIIFSKEYTNREQKEKGGPKGNSKIKETEQTDSVTPSSSSPQHHANTHAPSEAILREKKNPGLKTIFRKIATKIHPDKLCTEPPSVKKSLSTLFDKAKKAFEDNDYCAILSIADDLKISLPPLDRDQIEIMKEKNKEMEEAIGQIKRSVVWGWYHAENEEQRKQIMEKYAEYVNSNNSGP